MAVADVTTRRILGLVVGLVVAAPSQAVQIDWKDNMLTIAASWLPGGTLEIWYLEAFCRSGAHDRDWRETVLPHKTSLVERDPAGKRIVLQSVVEPGVRVTHEILAGSDEVSFHLELTNPTSKTVDIDWAQPCVRVDRFTGLGQEDYIRKCFVFTNDRLTTLDKTDRTEEARYRGGQVYVPPGVPHEDVNPRPISSDVPTNGLIGCFSADNRYLMATAWDSTEELFQGIIVCIHSDFRIGGMKPGETKNLFGKVYLLPNDVQALLQRYRKDFPHGSW